MQLLVDSKKLREILGNSITLKNWDILVHHTKTCKTNWKLYLYYPDGMRMHGAIFTPDGQLIGLIEDRVYFATHRLSAQEKERGDTIMKKAFDNRHDVREFNGGTFSGSMQKKSSSSFPSQVFERQIENLIPFQCNLAPQTCAAPVGPEAPLANAGSTVEGQSQNTNFGNANEFQVDESVLPAAHQPIFADQNANFGNAMMFSSDQPIPADHNANLGNAMMFSVDQPIPTDNLNVPLSPGHNGIPTVSLPNQSHDTNLQYAMSSQMIDSWSAKGYILNEHVLPTGPPYASTSNFQSIGPLPLPEGYHGMEDFPSTMADDTMYFWNDDTSFQTPLWDG